MRRVTHILLVALWAFHPMAAAGECQERPVECQDADGRKCAKPMCKGELAPFHGQLLTTELAIELGQKAHDFDKRLKLELKYYDKLTIETMAFHKRLHKIEVEGKQEYITFLEKELEKAEGGFWDHPGVVAVVAAVTAVLVVLGVRSFLK